MSSAGKLALSVKDRRAPTPSDQTLLTTLQARANWIWCPDTQNTGGPDPPSAPDGEQCIFRNKFFYSTSKGRPTTTTLILAADDYLALYVDGVSIQPSDITHDWKLMYAFQVPLPVVQNQTASSLLLGIRGVNKSGYVGLLVAVQVAYETGDPDVFYTGFSDEWRAQRLFDEGWEQPWYNSYGWRPASNVSESARSPSDSSLSMPTEVAVFDALSASAAPGGLQSESGQRMPIEFSIGEFAGILIGSILGAVIVGAIGAYLVLRRRHAHRSIEAWSDNDGVVARDHALMFEPLQLSAEPRSSSSHVIPSTSYEGSYRPTSATLSPVTVTQMVSSNANQNINIDLAPPMYSDSETPIVTSTRRK